ncbi:glutathione peroxidase [Paludibacterium yongneupense]|uniref:glutathione peroxidase n=1 Tax=Paludibacterium yongneupense TaxID=400061 RepID=UPI00041F3046|nr:glutathione peroxidase [Paludibacterium yongneupense]
MPVSLYDFEALSLQGRPIRFDELRGKVVLIVNTASRCGFTGQYEGLQALHRRYAERGLVIIGFPCNQFGRQEPGTDTEIEGFCRSNYGVDFALGAKVDVNGAGAHPLWRYLQTARPGLFGIQRIKWNFTKFLIDRNGVIVCRTAPWVAPHKLAPRIERLLDN